MKSEDWVGWVRYLLAPRKSRCGKRPVTVALWLLCKQQSLHYTLQLFLKSCLTRLSTGPHPKELGTSSNSLAKEQLCTATVPLLSLGPTR